MVRRVFISKNESEVDSLARYLSENGQKLVARSFLSFEPVQFSVKSKFDVLFFSSPRSVTFFKSGYGIPKGKLIACTGNKTKELLESLGFIVSFHGKQAGKISDIAKEFKDWCGEKRVLFPISSISKKTVSSLFSEKQKTELVVYETIITPCKIDDCDTYIFSSPSNVRGFLMENKIPKGAKVISWGESTSEELRGNGIQVLDEMLNSRLDDIKAYLC